MVQWQVIIAFCVVSILRVILVTGQIAAVIIGFAFDRGATVSHPVNLGVFVRIPRLIACVDVYEQSSAVRIVNAFVGVGFRVKATDHVTSTTVG